MSFILLHPVDPVEPELIAINSDHISMIEPHLPDYRHEGGYCKIYLSGEDHTTVSVKESMRDIMNRVQKQDTVTGKIYVVAVMREPLTEPVLTAFSTQEACDEFIKYAKQQEWMVFPQDTDVYSSFDPSSC